MDPVFIALISIAVLIGLILLGINIAYSLMLMSFLCVFFIGGSITRALGLMSTAAFDAVRSYTFCVIPLFMLMGSLMAKSGAAKDLFRFAHCFLRKIPGGLAVATVIGNAVFAAVTGVSVASASIFAKIAVPEMERYNYKKSFAVGTVAGTSVLGMLIPPSLLFIVYGTSAEESIGKMFVAGILPGIVLSLIFIAGIYIMGLIDPTNIGLPKKGEQRAQIKAVEENGEQEHFLRVLLSTLPIIFIIVLVLGGIWGGFFTPTEASAFGALGALIVAICKRTLTLRGFLDLFMEATVSSAAIMFLLIAAQMYSRMLATSGIVTWLSSLVFQMDLSRYLVIGLFLLLVLVLGCVLDSSSILLLTVPLIKPIILGYGYDMIWFGIVLVVTVEMGMLTPPFGMVVFAIKSALGDYMPLDKIFRGSLPFLVMIAIGVLLFITFPQISLFLPSLM